MQKQNRLTVDHVEQDPRARHLRRVTRVLARVRAPRLRDAQRAHRRALGDVLGRRGRDAGQAAPAGREAGAVVPPLDVVGRLQAPRDDALEVHRARALDEDVLVAVDAHLGHWK